MSRKKDFVPALTKEVTAGWNPPADVVREHSAERPSAEDDDGGEERSTTKTPAQEGEVTKSAMKRARSMVDIARGDVVVDYSDEPSGKLVRRPTPEPASGGGAGA